MAYRYGSSDGPVGISGWLLLPALGLIVTPVAIAIQFYQDLLPALSPSVWAVITNPQSENYVPQLAPLIIVEVLANVALFVFTLFVAKRFFTKSADTPKLYIIMLAAVAIFQMTDQLFVYLFNPIAIKSGDDSGLASMGRSIISAAIWITYFMKSKRVHNTFVNPV